MTARTLHAVELRDEAVRVLRRAVEHVQHYEFTQALLVVQHEGTAWWDLAQHEPAVQAFPSVGQS